MAKKSVVVGVKEPRPGPLGHAWNIVTAGFHLLAVALLIPLFLVLSPLLPVLLLFMRRGIEQSKARF